MSATPELDLHALLARCCASRRWVAVVESMASSSRWSGVEELLAAAERAFDALERDDWLEAFAGHPRIGDVAALRERFAVPASASPAGVPSETTGSQPAALDLARHEQSGTASASEATLRALAEGNARYDQRFGHLFLVFASGKTAEEMLELLESRLGNAPDDELRIASLEQRKISRKRLSDAADDILAAIRSVEEERPSVSAITTHVLDTTRGVPAAGVQVLLQRRDGSELLEIGRGRTDADGRLNDLTGDALVPGVYRLVFDVSDYFAGLDDFAADPFFPAVTIEFRFDEARGHVHVPLLISPFGYTTYRGS